MTIWSWVAAPIEVLKATTERSAFPVDMVVLLHQAAAAVTQSAEAALPPVLPNSLVDVAGRFGVPVALTACALLFIWYKLWPFAVSYIESMQGVLFEQIRLSNETRRTETAAFLEALKRRDELIAITSQARRKEAQGLLDILNKRDQIEQRNHAETMLLIRDAISEMHRRDLEYHTAHLSALRDILEEVRRQNQRHNREDS